MDIIRFFANASTAQSGLSDVNPDGSDSMDLMAGIKLILGAVFGIIGVIAVVMIILGGISYATSQGDPGKVKKGKDTILYGVIGLIVALLAFAIVNFVLGALGGGAADTTTTGAIFSL
jgi:hypothetical protein